MTTDEEIRAEARRRLEAERREFERRAAEQLDEIERNAANVRAEAQRRLVIEHVRGRFGRTLAVLRDPDALAALMDAAGLTRATVDTRVNPIGTTTDITTVHVPRLVAVGCTQDVIAAVFDLEIGQTLSAWTHAAEVLRTGLRANDIEISEPHGGQVQLILTA